jgi:type I site-specific restriction-modification system R (restriction) subunit
VTAFTESVVEEAALAWLEAMGWGIAHGPDIAPDMTGAERDDFGEVVLARRLRDALARLNPALPAEALEDAFRKLTRPEGADLVQRNRALHRLLVDGVTVEYRDTGGAIRGAQARVIDFDEVRTNDWLEQTIRRYQHRAVEAAQVIEELIALAKDMREANARGEVLGLSEDELAFYDALETNDSAVKVLGDETLRDIARELVATVRNNVTIDWTLRENVRAHLRVLVKRILRKHGYPPDKQEKATQTVLEQAALLSAEWVNA